MRTSRPERPSEAAREDLRVAAGRAFVVLIIGAAVAATACSGAWSDVAMATGAASAPSTSAPAAKPAPIAKTVGSTPAKTAANVPSKIAAKPAAAPTKVAVANAGGSKTVPARSASARPGAITVTSTPLVVGTTVNATHNVPGTHLEDRIAYQYNALGRRDPFQSLVDGGFVGDDVGGSAPPDVGGLKVVGIVWGAGDKFALAEDARGNSLVLRPGDKVMNGVVTGLRRDALLVNLTADGQTESVAIPLTRKGDNSNGNR